MDLLGGLYWLVGRLCGREASGIVKTVYGTILGILYGANRQFT